MAIQIVNNILDNCSSIEQVVVLINDELATDASAEMIAAKYAHDGADKAGYGINDSTLEAQLDVLVNAGVNFDYLDALLLAVLDFARG